MQKLYVSTILLYIYIGARIYVTRSYQQGYPTAAQPNNSLVIPHTYEPYYFYNNRLQFYCISDASAGYRGQFITPIGGILPVSRDSRNGQLYIYNRGYRYGGTITPYYQGIYTCRLPDSRGVQLEVSIGIYPHGFSCKFVIM